MNVYVVCDTGTVPTGVQLPEPTGCSNASSYNEIAEPPLDRGACHEIEISDVLSDVVCIFCGADGYVGVVISGLSADSSEAPITLIALTLYL